MNEMEAELLSQLQAGNVAMLSVGHAMTCGLKVLTTELACNGMEQCRRVRQQRESRYRYGHEPYCVCAFVGMRWSWIFVGFWYVCACDCHFFLDKLSCVSNR